MLLSSIPLIGYQEPCVLKQIDRVSSLQNTITIAAVGLIGGYHNFAAECRSFGAMKYIYILSFCQIIEALRCSVKLFETILEDVVLLPILISRYFWMDSPLPVRMSPQQYGPQWR